MTDFLAKINDAILSEQKPEPTIRSILHGSDFNHDNTQMIETQPETPTVDRMLQNFERMWNNTADDCIRRAEELEGAALDLRERAQRLRDAIELTAEVKGAVVFEINARNRAMSLALVNPNREG